MEERLQAASSPSPTSRTRRCPSGAASRTTRGPHLGRQAAASSSRPGSTSRSARSWACSTSSARRRSSGSRFAFYKGGPGAARAGAGGLHDRRAHRARATLELLPPYLVTARSDDRHRAAPQVRGRRVQDRRRPRSASSSPPPRCRSPTTTPTRSSRASSLPLRYCAFSPCFRAEAGAAGQGHPRADPPAPVPQGGAGEVRHARDQSMEELEAHGGRRERGAPPPGAAPPGGAALHRRHGLRLAEDLRPRGLAARAGRVPGDLLAAATAATSRPGGRRSASAPPKGEKPQLSTPSTAAAWPWGGRSSPSWRTTSARTERVAFPRSSWPYMGGMTEFRPA